MKFPDAPEFEGEWTNRVNAYADALNKYVLHELEVAQDKRLHWKITDKLRHTSTLLMGAIHEKDYEMVFIYGDWIGTIMDSVAIRSTTLILRKHYEGSVRHLITRYRIEACQAVTEALTSRGRTNWENNRECAYLAFDDPSLLPKVVYLLEQGVFMLSDVQERLEDMNETPLPLVAGAL